MHLIVNDSVSTREVVQIISVAILAFGLLIDKVVQLSTVMFVYRRIVMKEIRKGCVISNDLTLNIFIYLKVQGIIILDGEDNEIHVEVIQIESFLIIFVLDNEVDENINF